ncbi:MAG: type VI secretion system tip protein TssI/VgrG [Myxococcota bacterium]
MSATASAIRYGVAIEADDGDWVVQRVHLDEALDRPWILHLEIAIDTPFVDSRLMVGCTVTVTAEREEEAHVRCIDGVVVASEHRGRQHGATILQLTVQPPAAKASEIRRSRALPGRPFLELVAEVLGSPVESARLGRQYADRDFFVQYDETDLAAAQRLLSEEGITAQFTTDGGAVVLTDDNAGFANLDADPLEPRSGDIPMVSVHALAGAPASAIEMFLRTDHGPEIVCTETGWDWMGAPPVFVHHHVSAAGDDAGRQRVHARRRLPERDATLHDVTRADAVLEAQRREQSRVRIVGESSHLQMRPGAVFELQGHPDPDFDVAYVIVRVEHRGEGAVAGDSGPWSGADYENRFECVPLGTPIRPPARAKPSIASVQTALVVGDTAGRVHTDAHGRVRLQFPWDEGSEPSCFARVAQAWAGDNFGTVFLPRVGMEVVVSFVDGDPERPLVTGCVYNGANTPPWALPEHRTRSGLVTRSCPDGVGHNELRFEDADGAEEVYLHAQRNLRRVVRANASTRVGGSRSCSIGKDTTLQVGANRRCEIADDDALTVGASQQTVVVGGRAAHVQCDGVEASDALVVDGARSQTIRDAWTLAVGDEVQVEATTERVDLVAPAEIALQVGNSKLRITPDAIVLDAAHLLLSASGSELELRNYVRCLATEAIDLEQGSGAAKVALVGGEITANAGESITMTSARGAGLELDAGIAQRGATVRITAPGAEISASAGGLSTTAAKINTNAAGAHVVTGLPIRLN